MIETEKLNKFYGDRHVLKDVNLRVDKGELFAYLGPNGAGKTTTIRILTGLTRLSSGKVSVNGWRLDKDPHRVRRQNGVATQSVNLDQELTVRENLKIHARLYGMPNRVCGEKIGELLDYVELSDRGDSLVKRLSGGMKRRLMIARALLHDPKVLFLDEPTVGLDPKIRRRIWALVKRIQQRGTTVFLTTHYIEEAEFLADRVAFLHEGAVVATDTPRNHMARLGDWAIDIVDDDGLRSDHFPTRDQAQEYAASVQGAFTIRRVNLEDAFLELTGKKVAP